MMRLPETGIAQTAASKTGASEIGTVAIEHFHWHQAQLRQQACAIRTRVFIEEQGVTAAEEWDGLDNDAVHFLVYAEKPPTTPVCSHTASNHRVNSPAHSGNTDVNTPATAVATARLLKNGHIGRVAVLQPWRQRGVGRALMQALLAFTTQQNYPLPHLNAQVQALDFYRQLGFHAVGDVFLDAGIEHLCMEYRAPTSGS